MKEQAVIPMRISTERGIAMITMLLVLMLMSALLVGFTTVVMSDQRYRFIDRDRGQAFYAASGAVEKLTADLGNLFLVNVAPTAAQVTALTATSAKPVITGITFTRPTRRAPCRPASCVVLPLQGAKGRHEGRHQRLHRHVLRRRDRQSDGVRRPDHHLDRCRTKG